MTLSYTADSAAPSEAVWKLLSEPSEWHRWAPHLRGAIGMGQPEVHAGALGLALLGGVVPLPGLVVGKRPGRQWSWQVGLIRVDHSVEPRENGSRVTVELSAPWALERLLAVSYGPVVAVLVRRLATQANGA